MRIIDWIWSRYELVLCISVLQKVPPWRVYHGKGIPLRALLSEKAQNASHLQFFLVVQMERYQLRVCLASESLRGSQSLSNCS